MPSQLCAFDYSTISDVILHVRYTAREAGEPLASQATKELIKTLMPKAASQSLMFCLRYDFPSELAAFVNGNGNFSTTLLKDFFPYMVQSASQLSIDALTLYVQSATKPVAPVSLTPQGVDANFLAALSTGLAGQTGAANLALPADNTVLTRDPSRQVFLVLKYSFAP